MKVGSLLQITALAAAFGAVGVGRSDGTEDRPMGPSAAVDVYEVNLGDVPVQSPVSHPFVIRNDGDAALTVRVAHTSCACVAPIVDHAVVEPGERTTVIVSAKADRTGKPGALSLYVVMATNDPEKREVMLQLRARLVAPVSVTPDAVDFGDVPVGATPSRAVTLGRNDGEEGGVLGRLVQTPGFADVVPRRGVRRGDDTTDALTVTLRPQDQARELRGYIALTTTSVQQPLVEIPVRARVVSGGAADGHDPIEEAP